MSITTTSSVLHSSAMEVAQSICVKFTYPHQILKFVFEKGIQRQNLYISPEAKTRIWIHVKNAHLTSLNQLLVSLVCQSILEMEKSEGETDIAKKLEPFREKYVDELGRAAIIMCRTTITEQVQELRIKPVATHLKFKIMVGGFIGFMFTLFFITLYRKIYNYERI